MLHQSVLGSFHPEQINLVIIEEAVPKLKQAEIHVGSEDWQSKPDNFSFGEAVSIPVNIVQGKAICLG